MKSNWNRYPGGKQISTVAGEKIREWFYRRASHTFNFGLSFLAVRFADHRSGWSGVNMHVGLGWLEFSCTILAWKNGYGKKHVQLVSLAEQIRRTHSLGPTLEEQEALEAEDRADERARMELFNKQLKEFDARHQQPESK